MISQVKSFENLKKVYMDNDTRLEAKRWWGSTLYNHKEFLNDYVFSCPHLTASWKTATISKNLQINLDETNAHTDEYYSHKKYHILWKSHLTKVYVFLCGSVLQPGRPLGTYGTHIHREVWICQHQREKQIRN